MKNLGRSYATLMKKLRHCGYITKT